MSMYGTIHGITLDPTPLGLLSALIVLLAMIMECVETWVLQDWHGGENDQHWGLFLRTNQYQTDCDTATSTTSCGYLKSAQASGILFILMGVWTTLVYIPRVFPNIPVGANRMLTAGSTGMMQGIFGVLCLVFFSCWKDSRLAQEDRTNIEYENEKFHSTFMATYYLFVILTIVVIMQASAAVFMYKNVRRHSKKRDEVDTFLQN